MKLSEIRKILSDESIQLTKSLGQNFLHDSNQIQRILDAGELSKGTKVLEIGPGLGPMTETLLAKTGHVLAIETDRRLVDFLSRRFKIDAVPARSQKPPRGPDEEWQDPAKDAQLIEPYLQDEEARLKSANAGLWLLHGDALVFFEEKPWDWSDWKLVSNLPYSVASPLLVDLAQNPRGPDRMAVTLQWEVAQRLEAKAGDADYGVLALLIQLTCKPVGCFKIPPSCFFPEPGIMSACITLQRRSTPLLPTHLHREFRKLVKRSFSQRRKMMLKLVKADYPLEKLRSAFDQLHISEMARAETVSLEQFVQLTQMLAPDASAQVADEVTRL